MEQKILITINAYGISHTSELPEDCSAIEFIETFSNLAESVGFSSQLVIDGLRQTIETRE